MTAELIRKMCLLRAKKWWIFIENFREARSLKKGDRSRRCAAQETVSVMDEDDDLLCACVKLLFMVLVHVLPREVCGKSTFELAVSMMKWLPLWIVDKLLLIMAWLILGNIERYGLKRPSKGPLELKNEQGKTPVLDIGALSRIRSGDIRVVPGIKKFTTNSVELIDDRTLDIDSVILATGYKSNVPFWLKENELFDKNGFPKSQYPNGWKGKKGIYAVGFTRKGLSGASSDAVKIADDIGRVWKEEETIHKRRIVPLHRSCISTF